MMSNVTRRDEIDIMTLRSVMMRYEPARQEIRHNESLMSGGVSP